MIFEIKPIPFSFESFGHRMKHALMHPQWVPCYLMWLVRLSYLACLKLRKSPRVPKGFSPDHRDGFQQLRSTACGISEHLRMFGHILTARRDQWDNIYKRYISLDLWEHNRPNDVKSSGLHSFPSLFRNMGKQKPYTP